MIKKVSELAGVLVIALKEGKEAGKVKEIVIDSLKNKILAIILEGEKWYEEARVVTSSVIKSAGEYAIIIESISSISKVSSNPEIVALLDKKIKEKGRRVITESGRLVGTVSEYFVNLQTQEVVAYELATDYIIPASAVITTGEDFLVVSDDVEKKIITDISQIEKKEKKVEEKKIQEQPQVKVKEEITSHLEKKAEEPQKKQPERETPPLNLNKIFEEKQKTFMLGRRLRKTLQDSEGGIIAEAGEIVTEEIINKAIEKGKFPELFMLCKP